MLVLMSSFDELPQPESGLHTCWFWCPPALPYLVCLHLFRHWPPCL